MTTLRQIRCSTSRSHEAGRRRTLVETKTESAFGPRWVTLTILSAIAIVCLPRQFQVTVVENADEDHLRTASWLFPVYLLLISIFVLPIATVGLSVLPYGANPDKFVLTLPMYSGENTLALFAFIGGFSSATSMVIVASIALSIMVSNHVVMPIVLGFRHAALPGEGDIKRLLLITRRISIAVILMLGFLYFRLSTRTDALASIGLIAFVGVAQLAPSLIGGLFWRNGNAAGAVAGLGAGFVLWIYTLFLPSFAGETGLVRGWVDSGPVGVELLRPEALFGLEGLDPLGHALFWSLAANTLVYLVASLASQARPIERLQSALFVDVFRDVAVSEPAIHDRSARVDDLYLLAQRILGPAETEWLFADAARAQGIIGTTPTPDATFIAQLERRLAGTIGAASVRVMVSQVATGESISIGELIKLVDETQQVIESRQRLQEKSRELEIAARQLREANAQLRQLDAHKDDFLSQVSHEVRTPMTSIRSFTEILLEEPDIDPEETRRFLSIVHDESLRLTRLLDEILELAPPACA